MKNTVRKTFDLGRSARRGFTSFVGLTLAVFIIVGAVPAQEAKIEASVSNVAPSDTRGQTSIIADERYRIGPGDVLDIRVFNRPQLSREARVDTNGVIQMPLLEGDIQAACLTENELAQKIVKLYLKYQRNPYVNVFVKEYSSTPVAVIGSVEKPGRFQLTRRVRLLELLAFAGGPNQKAGGKVQIAHTGGISLCDAAAPQGSELFDFYPLVEALRGVKDSNPYIRPGDIVSIPEADQAYVVGNVFKPQAVLLKEPVTVSQAISMAGGYLRATKMSKVQIVRQAQGSAQKEIIAVNLSAINKLQAEDILLLPNDVVQVPTDEGKLLMDKLIGALTGGLSSLPYVIQ